MTRFHDINQAKGYLRDKPAGTFLIFVISRGKDVSEYQVVEKFKTTCGNVAVVKQPSLTVRPEDGIFKITKT